MAQPTKWVPAILDDMKKVKSNISTSHPYQATWRGYSPTLHLPISVGGVS